MRRQLYSLVLLAFLSTAVAGLVWQLVLRNSQYYKFVAETSAEAAQHIDESKSTLKQISASLVIAKRENKRVLLQFGSKS